MVSKRALLGAAGTLAGGGLLIGERDGGCEEAPEPGELRGTPRPGRGEPREFARELDGRNAEYLEDTDEVRFAVTRTVGGGESYETVPWPEYAKTQGDLHVRAFANGVLDDALESTDNVVPRWADADEPELHVRLLTRISDGCVHSTPDETLETVAAASPETITARLSLAGHVHVLAYEVYVREKLGSVATAG